MSKKIKVKQSEEEPIAVEILADSIKKIGDAVDKINDSMLSKRAIVLLLCSASGESQRVVKNVLWALENLKVMYLKGKQ